MLHALPLGLLLACADQPLPAAPSWQDCEIALPTDAPEEADAWYLCVDGRIHGGEGCGDQGYLLGFGGKYAEKYMVEVRPDLGPEGQAFLDGVLVCLQEALAEGMAEEPECADIESLGFSSHVPCYLEHGFCELPIEDIARIGVAVEAEDRGRPEQEEAIAEIQAACAG
jgi:hypothetical protein